MARFRFLSFVGFLAIYAGACSPAASSGAGSGGSSGSGGSGSGGSGMSANCINSADDLIADFTDDNGIAAVDGRAGGFYTYGDDSKKSGAVLTPAEGTTAGIDDMVGNNECSRAGSLRVTATGFKIWGAALGTNFAPMKGSFKGWYNASKYKGISFWAKAATELKGVQVSFPDVNTDGGANAKDADPSITEICSYGSATNNCSPFLVKFGDADFPHYKDTKIDTTWRRFDVMFADTQQDKNNVAGYLLPVIGHVDLEHLTAMAVQVNAIHNADSSVSANDFDIWIDDVNFIK